MLSSLGLLALVWLLVPQWGLLGLVWAQIGQGAAMLLLGWGLLRRELPALPRLKLVWDASLFREMFRYGFSFQLITLLGMLLDPVSKALMTLFGGLSATAYYEMANRMVGQLRALLVAANQAVVPKIAGLHERAPGEIGRMYAENYRVMFFMSLPLYTAVAMLAPLAGEFWIGHYEERFVLFAALFSLAYWINTLAAPAYFVNLGTGRLGWNVAGTVVTTVANAVLGYLLGTLAGGTGVAWGGVLATMTGSGLLLLGYHRDHRISCAGLLPGESRWLLLACSLGLAAAWAVQDRGGLAGLVCLAVIAPAFWVHPLRQRLHERFVLAFSTSGR
jgi:O-antigen/teichoic acid export membrane protein